MSAFKLEWQGIISQITSCVDFESLFVQKIFAVINSNTKKALQVTLQSFRWPNNEFFFKLLLARNDSAF